jgi:hypothetical protein
MSHLQEKGPNIMQPFVLDPTFKIYFNAALSNPPSCSDRKVPKHELLSNFSLDNVLYLKNPTSGVGPVRTHTNTHTQTHTHTHTPSYLRH